MSSHIFLTATETESVENLNRDIRNLRHWTPLSGDQSYFSNVLSSLSEFSCHHKTKPSLVSELDPFYTKVGDTSMSPGLVWVSYPIPNGLDTTLYFIGDNGDVYIPINSDPPRLVPVPSSLLREKLSKPDNFTLRIVNVGPELTHAQIQSLVTEQYQHVYID